MAKLPSAFDLGTRPEPNPANGVVGYNVADGGGEALGMAGMEFGQMVGKFAEVEQEKINTIRAEDALNKLRQTQLDLTVGEQNGFVNKRGADAVTQPILKDYTTKFTDAARKISEDLGNDAQRGAFQKRADAAQIEFQQNLLTHITRERGAYDSQVFADTIAAEVRNAGANPANWATAASALVRMDSAIQNEGRRLGLAPESVDNMKAQALDRVWESRLDAWRLVDPIGALATYQKNAGDMSPKLRLKLGESLFRDAAPVLAGQLVADGGVGLAAPVQAAPAAVQTAQPSVPGAISMQDVTGNAPTTGAALHEGNLRALQEERQRTKSPDVLKVLDAEIASETALLAKAETEPARVAKADTGTASDAPPAAAGAVVSSAARPSLQEYIKNPALTTGNAIVDALPADEKLHVISLAAQQTQKVDSADRERMRYRIQDTEAEYRATGRAANPPSEDELIRTLGPVDGLHISRRLKEVATFGQNLQQIKTLPDAAINSLVAASKPEPGEGFADRERNYEQLVGAAQQVRAARENDPIAYALVTNGYSIKPIANMQDTAGIASELERRVAAAQQIAADYRTPFQILTKAESSMMASVIKAAPVDVQKKYLGAIYGGIKDMDAYRATMAQLAPDAPSISWAGIAQAKQFRTSDNRDVADLVLRGEALVNPNKKTDGSGHEGGKSLIKMPDANLMRMGFDNVVKDAYTGKSQARDLVYQVATRAYAALSDEAGDHSGQINNARWGSAIMLATGGIERYNGNAIVMPYGMPLDKFRDGLRVRMGMVEPNNLDSYSFTLNPDNTLQSYRIPVSVPELMSLPLENAGDGRYYVRRGSGYIVLKDGNPLVIDFNKWAPDAKSYQGIVARRDAAFITNRGGAATGRTWMAP